MVLSVKHFPERSNVSSVLGTVYGEYHFIEELTILLIDKNLSEISCDISGIITESTASPGPEYKVSVSVFHGDQKKYTYPS